MISPLRLLKNIWKVENIRKKFLITLLVFAVFRAVAVIPVPGMDHDTLRQLFAGNAFLSLLDIFSGGTLANFSLLALGVGPYINASIITQMLTFVVPAWEELSQEGEYGREKINQYTRWLTLPIAIVQSIGLLYFLRSNGIAIDPSALSVVSVVTTMVAGTFFVLWLGEILTQYGIGNGVSLIIFAGIAGRLPVVLAQTSAVASGQNITNLAAFGLLSAIVIYFVVKVNEATRQITVQYARRSRSGTTAGSQLTHLPLKLNQAGVIPIIFAVSLMLVPSFMANFLVASSNDFISQIGYFMSNNLTPQAPFYSLVYFTLVVLFTYFYTSVVFNPERIAEQLKKNGGFVPGIRPGVPTANYLAGISNKITLAGAMFLGLIAVLPNLAQQISGISTLAIGGTGILIVVSVVLETSKEIESQLVMHSYDKFLR
jgi:preprotein translocase subunit SecY